MENSTDVSELLQKRHSPADLSLGLRFKYHEYDPKNVV